MNRILWISLTIVCLTAPASAEWYVAGDLLQARYAGPTVDGTWKQDLIPQGSELDGTSLAYDAGLGYRFAGGASAWSRIWSVEAGYRNWGSVVASGKWVSDEEYTAVMQYGSQIMSERGMHPPHSSATDHLQGGYLRVAKGVDVGHGIEPFVSAGVFVAVHTMNFNHNPRTIFSGPMAGPTVGGGVKYDVYQGIKVRASVDSHWSLTESGHPISSQWLTVGGGLEVPLKGLW